MEFDSFKYAPEALLTVNEDVPAPDDLQWQVGTLVLDQLTDKICRVAGFRRALQKNDPQGFYLWEMEVPVDQSRGSQWQRLQKPLVRVSYPVTPDNQDRFLFLLLALSAEDYAVYKAAWEEKHGADLQPVNVQTTTRTSVNMDTEVAQQFMDPQDTPFFRVNPRPGEPVRKGRQYEVVLMYQFGKDTPVAHPMGVAFSPNADGQAFSLTIAEDKALTEAEYEALLPGPLSFAHIGFTDRRQQKINDQPTTTTAAHSMLLRIVLVDKGEAPVLGAPPEDKHDRIYKAAFGDYPVCRAFLVTEDHIRAIGARDPFGPKWFLDSLKGNMAVVYGVETDIRTLEGQYLIFWLIDKPMHKITTFEASVFEDGFRVTS
jgi:hypothetical protein